MLKRGKFLHKHHSLDITNSLILHHSLFSVDYWKLIMYDELNKLFE